MAGVTRTPQNGSGRPGRAGLTRRMRLTRFGQVGFDGAGTALDLGAALADDGNGHAHVDPAAPGADHHVAAGEIGVLSPKPRFRPPSLPKGRPVVLGTRGTTWVHEHAGPPGAPVLFLLHGWTATGGLNWFRSFPRLARSFRVVTIDHRGHGRGIRDDRRFILEDCADDVVALADALGVDRFIPVGYSMGGPIAQLVWRRHPDRVSGLVMCATSRNFRGTPTEKALFSTLAGLSVAARFTPAPWRQQLNSRLVLRRYDDSDLGLWARREVSMNDPRVMFEAGCALGRYSSHEWIGEIDVPTAVVVTEADSVVPPVRQRKLAGAIPGARTFAVAADHAACVMRPELFVPALVTACRHATSTTTSPAEREPTPS